jgi:hypothetical protein
MLTLALSYSQLAKLAECYERFWLQLSKLTFLAYQNAAPKNK